jgi:hypothetical protein
MPSCALVDGLSRCAVIIVVVSEQTGKVLCCLIVTAGVVAGLCIVGYFVTEIIRDLNDKPWWEVLIGAVVTVLVAPTGLFGLLYLRLKPPSERNGN